ncbi:hypothetical protein [Paenibacillus rhizolycopersici]|uniref:hypothetical protein n=1 Tax=Paenibacillus rhizolycopersici TaxID=2780073 RepID=UPI003D2B5DEB
MKTMMHGNRMYRDTEGYGSFYLEPEKKVEFLIPGKGVVNIDSDGIVRVDAGNHGHAFNLFELTESSAMTSTNRDERLNRITGYLHLLFESQKCGHDVHKEIEEALKKCKEWAGV